MKYPKLNGTELSKENRFRFDLFKKVIKESISFDNQENDLRLTKSDVELLTWNAATHCIAMFVK